MNIAYNMDCMEYMRTLPDKAFDLAVVDPPYGIKINMNAGRRRNAKNPKREKRVGIMLSPKTNTFQNCLGHPKIKSSGEEIISPFPEQELGLFGTNMFLKNYLFQAQNFAGHLLIKKHLLLIFHITERRGEMEKLQFILPKSPSPYTPGYISAMQSRETKSWILT